MIATAAIQFEGSKQGGVKADHIVDIGRNIINAHGLRSGYTVFCGSLTKVAIEVKRTQVDIQAWLIGKGSWCGDHAATGQCNGEWFFECIHRGCTLLNERVCRVVFAKFGIGSRLNGAQCNKMHL